MPIEKPIINNVLLLEKFPGKGGWTYAQIPDILPRKKTGFGWLKVKGTIDDFKIEKYNLAPMGHGRLFLPVKAAIRKTIKKEAGDSIRVILYLDNEPITTPEELWLCLEDEPTALNFYKKLRESEQQHYISWIYSAKHDETKVTRIIKMIDRLNRGLKMYDVEI